jgi:hypothetical protein
MNALAVYSHADMHGVNYLSKTVYTHAITDKR